MEAGNGARQRRSPRHRAQASTLRALRPRGPAFVRRRALAATRVASRIARRAGRSPSRPTRRSWRSHSWRIPGRSRSGPTDLSRSESGAADQSCGDRSRIPAEFEKQGSQSDHRQHPTLDDAASLAVGENRGPAGFGRETSRDINAGLPIGPATEVSTYPPCRKTRAVGGGSLRRQRAVAEGGKRLAAGAGSGGYGGGAVCSSGGIVGDSPRARWRRAAARANWRSMLRSGLSRPQKARWASAPS